MRQHRWFGVGGAVLALAAVVGWHSLPGAGPEPERDERADVVWTDDRVAEEVEARVSLERSLLADAQAEIASLGGRVVEAQARLVDAEARLAASRTQGAVDKRERLALAERVRGAEQAVVRLQEALDAVVAERDGLAASVADLELQLLEGTAGLDQARAREARWQRDSVLHAWTGFVADAKVSLCDKGTRRRHAACAEAVEAMLDDDVHARFEACVRSRQAVPVVVEGEGQLPDFAAPLPDDRRLVSRDHYIQFCDPTLPEAASG